MLLHDEEGLSGLGPFREGVHAVYAGVDLEVEDGGGYHGSANGYDADDWSLGDYAGHNLPEPMLGGLGGAAFRLAKEGDGEAVDSGAKERKGGRQQGEGGR